MSWQPAEAPSADREPCPALETVIVPRARDLGGFEVRRALPSAKRQMVGPFIFWDQMGPAMFDPGHGIEVRPHPHIGLATLTYLFDGEILHRDSLGSVQPIRPGEVNLMTAGRGIVHSERADPRLKATGGRLFGIQSWMALPKAVEETAPAFVHLSAADLPLIDGEGKRVRLVAGRLYGERSTLPTASETIYADAILEAGAVLPLPADWEERAIYVAEGVVDVAGDRFEAGRLLVFRPGDRIDVKAVEPARVVLLGGEPMDGPRHIWWNFVSSSAERIAAAKADWSRVAREGSDWGDGLFPAVPGDPEFVPLPG